MWQCEGWLLGRRPLSGGPVDAASLARLVRSLGAAAPRPQPPRRPPMLLRCRDDRLELAARHDDEGFESDDDSRSLASDDTAVSNSSSCCFVDDHVYRRGAGAGAGKVTSVPPPPRPVPPPGVGVAGPLASASSTTSDSANSSGASDTDDADQQPAAAGSVAALVQSLSLYQRVVKAAPAPAAAPAAEPEAIAVADVAFCHTDPALPRVAVWVVRRRRSAWAAAALDDAASQAPAGLEAIVFETNNERALRKLCNHFQEVSRRLKLDQYRHPHRRKEGAGVATLGRPPAYSALVQPSASASPSPSSSSSSSSSFSPSPSPVGKQPPASLSSGVSSSSGASTSSGGSTKSQQRLEAAKAAPHHQHHQQQVFQRLEAPAVVARFNLLQRTDGDGVTHLEVARDTALPGPQSRGPGAAPAASSPSGPSSIISLSTPDAPAPPPAAAATKQRPILVLGPRSDQLEAAELRKVWSPRPPPSPPPPPQRPERRRFARKSHKAPAPPPPSAQQQHPAGPGSKGDRNKALRSQLVSPSSAWPQYSVVRGSAWCAQPRSRSKSPPRPRRAAAAASSRYAEAARFLGGLSQRLRDAVGGGGGGGGHPHPQQHCSLYGTAARRRSTPDVFRSAENLLAGAGGHRLKSVIKKSRRPDCRAEPKKVTFSAYATVQVVD